MEIKCIVLTAAALVFGVHSGFAQGTNVGIATTGNQSVLYWPNGTINSFVQATTNLASPNWAAPSDAVPVNAITVNNASPSRFFRLASLPAGLALVPAGPFTMGDTLDGEADALPVTN